jgi:hypothetical protein
MLVEWALAIRRELLKFQPFSIEEALKVTSVPHPKVTP